MPGHSLQTLWERSLVESIGWHWWLSQDQRAAAAWVDRPPATKCQGESKGTLVTHWLFHFSNLSDPTSQAPSAFSVPEKLRL